MIGLPGDTIRMIAGRLHINGQPVERTRVEDEVESHGATTVRIIQYVETLPGGIAYRVREERGDNGMLDNTQAFEVPADHYFVSLADFRDRPTVLYWSQDCSRIGLRVQ